MKLPQQFGKYLLLERVSVGGMAEVFKAKSFGVEGFEKLVAIKRILPNIAEDEDFITMFIDEAKIAVQLNHANIAQIFDLGRIGDSYFIALEFVHGKDLRTIWERHRRRGLRLPIPMSVYIMARVCEGLDYAHRKRDAAGRHLNIVHRDVSPQNVLISYEGEVKIIDFGIAKAANKASKTQAGILKGKFGYMSPEQVRGLPLDCRSDVFSAGIVLYELLTGERLFVADSDFATLEKIRKADVLPPRTYNQKIPEELERIVLKALSKDPDDRFQTAYDMQEELQRFLIASGMSFSRKDLANYMKKAFRGDIARELERNKQYEEATMPTQPGDDEPSQVTVPELPGPKSASKAKEASPLPPVVGEKPAPAERVQQVESLELVSLAEDDEEIETVVWDARAAMEKDKAELAEAESDPAAAKPRPPPLPGSGHEQGGTGLDFTDSTENTVPGPSPTVSDDPADTASEPDWSPFGLVEEDVVTASEGMKRPDLRAARKPTLKIVVLVLAVVSIGVFSFAAFRMAKKKGWLGGRAELVLRTQHRGVEILVDGKRIVPEVSEGDGGFRYLLRDIATGKHKLEVRAKNYKPFSQVVDLVSGPQVLDVSLSFVPATLKLEVSPPEAKVSLDGTPLEGQSPYKIAVPPGKHQLVVEMRGFVKQTLSVELEPKQVVEKKVLLQPRRFALKIDSSPKGATVLLDEKPRGVTPLRLDNLDASRKYRLSLRKEGYIDFSSTIVYDGNPLKEIEIPLQPEGKGSKVQKSLSTFPRNKGASRNARKRARTGTGYLRINSRPWGRIFIDGRDTGSDTPQLSMPVAAGKHTVTIRFSNGGTKSVEIDVSAGETKKVIIVK